MDVEYYLKTDDMSMRLSVNRIDGRVKARYTIWAGVDSHVYGGSFSYSEENVPTDFVDDPIEHVLAHSRLYFGGSDISSTLGPVKPNPLQLSPPTVDTSLDDRQRRILDEFIRS